MMMMTKYVHDCSVADKRLHVSRFNSGPPVPER